MKAILAALLVTAVGAAHADTYQFTPPEGWQRHEELGAGIGRRALAENHFGGIHFKAAAVAWVRPGTGALYLTSLLSKQPSKNLEGDARGELDVLRATTTAAGPPSSVEVVSWEEATQDGMVGATLHWRHLSNETETMARQLVFADKDGRLRVFRAECVLSADASAEPRQACQAALSSLQVAVGPELRKAIGELPPAAEPEADQPLELRKDLEPIPGSSTEISGPGTAKRTVLYSKKQKDESKSHRWLFLAGAVILVVGLYLTARTRGGHGDKTAPPADDSDDQTDDDGNGEGEGDNDDEGDR